MITTNKKGGFSLIELLVALSILAVVAAIIVPRFLNVRGQAAATAAEAQRQTIQTAVQQFISLGGTIPAGAGVADIMGFLATTPTVSGGVPQQRTAINGVTDSSGNFGSTTISLPITPKGTFAQGVANAAEGFYFALAGGSAGARYVDGAGVVHDITITNNPGTVTFTP